VPAKIRWVLTVPALWSEEHKLFMRKAAVASGIIEQTNSPNLLLCLEVTKTFFDLYNNMENSPKALQSNAEKTLKSQSGNK